MCMCVCVCVCVSYSKLPDKVVSHVISSPLFLPLGMISWCFKHCLATTEEIIAKPRATFFQEAVHVRNGFAQQSQGVVAAPRMDWLRSAAWNSSVFSVECPWSLMLVFVFQFPHSTETSPKHCRFRLQIPSPRSTEGHTHAVGAGIWDASLGFQSRCLPFC